MEAARSTAELIEEATRNAHNGVRINGEVLQNLMEINSQVKKVSEVMNEITTVSDTQRTGVSMVSTAVDQMSQVTQQVAAKASESASAAEELSGQSEEMRSMVASFRLSHIGGHGSLKDTRLQVSKEAAAGCNGKFRPFSGDAALAHW